MKKHNWKTLYEMVTGVKPYLFYLKIYGCKAYAFKHHIPRKQKLESCAHIGYLVGYDSTNIFRIWIPSRRKVIRPRDVLFNKKEFYSPADTPDLLYFLSQPLGSSQPYLITENIRLAFSDLDAEDKKLTETFT